MQRLEDLNDLRLVYLIHSTGSLTGAAALMKVNHATIFRRLNQLEQRLGVRVFERDNGRYQATLEGEVLAKAGEAMNDTASEALLQVVGRDLRPCGAVHIATTDSLALTILPPILVLCRAQYPQITLTLEINNHMVNLTKRDADIAIRPTLEPAQHLLGKQLGDLSFAIYAGRDYWARHSHLSLGEQQWIALDEHSQGHRTLLWLEKLVPLNDIGFRTSNFFGVRQACLAQLGLAILPCFIAESCEEIQRIGEPLPECGSQLWLLTHPDLRDTARIKVIFKLLQAHLPTALENALANTRARTTG
jgi:DNA-binding transcriptional LysR family regulator